MKWQANGELAGSDLFAQVCELEQVETEERRHELWRLGHRYPQG